MRNAGTSLLERMALGDYEQTVFCSDRSTGLRSIIAIHDTTLGPALGGVRMYAYASEEQALADCLRLARGMTYKAAAAGLHLGGGKSVIIGDPQTEKTEALLRAHGRFIQTLNGRYIPGIDIGTGQRDMEILRLEVARVSCDGRDPSYFTALGVRAAIYAAAAEAFGDRSLKGRRVAIQGVGHVGTHLAGLLVGAGAEIIVCDTDTPRAHTVAERLGVQVTSPDEIASTPCDIFAPCALGGVVNDATIDEFTCRAMAGAANNVLAESRHAQMLAERGIVYAPDFLSNAGGLICLEGELLGQDDAQLKRNVMGIGRRIDEVFARARGKGITSTEAAEQFAIERLQSPGGDAPTADRGLAEGIV